MREGERNTGKPLYPHITDATEAMRENLAVIEHLSSGEKLTALWHVQITTAVLQALAWRLTQDIIHDPDIPTREWPLEMQGRIGR